MFRCRPLSRSDMEKIHDRSLHLLDKVGIKIPHGKCLQALADAGARVDFGSQTATFPERLVEASLKTATTAFTLAARDPRHDIVFPHPTEGFYTRTACGPRGFIDAETGDYRAVTIRDQEEWSRVADALDQIDFCGNISPQDVPPTTLSLHATKAMLENTARHLMVQAYSEGSLEYLARMAVAVVGSEKELARRPILHWSSCVLTPLSYKRMDAEAYFVAARYDLPIRITSLPIAGATAPITIAGIVLLTNLELLGGVVISQAAKPGLPVMHQSLQFAMDMVTGVNLQGCPEAILASAASAQLTRERYGIPAHVYGVGSDALTLGAGAMSERGLMGLLTALSGADILGGAGQVECASTASLVQLVIDDDVMGCVRKSMTEIDVSDEALGCEAIAQVGHGGNFLDQEHTLRHCSEAFRPKSASRKPRPVWEAEGAKDVLEVATERLNRIRKQHRPLPLPTEVRKELEAIVRAAETELGERN